MFRLPVSRSSGDAAANDPEAYERAEAAFEARLNVKPIEPWRRAWRGFASQFQPGALLALAEALRADSVELIQGSTMAPPFLHSQAGETPCAVCPVGFLARTERADTSGEIEAQFAEACYRASRYLGDEVHAERRFLNWWDDNPREVVVAALLGEIEVELAARGIRPRPAPVEAVLQLA